MVTGGEGDGQSSGDRGCPFGHRRSPVLANGGGGLVQLDQLVLLAAEADRFAVFERVHAVAGVDAFDQMDLAVIFRSAHQVGTGFVQ